MKTVTIEGKEYEVPDEANYIAMDENDEWWWYTTKPTLERYEIGTSCWGSSEDKGYICTSTYWETTLTKIE